MKRLLIVEDSPALRLTLMAACEDAGYEVIEAWDGRDALVKVTLHAPDLVLCDLMMPTMDGRAVLDRLREHPDHAHIPVIIMTRFRDGITELDPSIPVLIKPFLLPDLLAAIEAQLAR